MFVDTVKCRGTAAQGRRLVERTMQLIAFYSATGELPSGDTPNMHELGLFLFLEVTIRPRYRSGTLCQRVTQMLAGIPGALAPPEPEPAPEPAITGNSDPPTARRAAFERWLIRAEIYTTRHGYRPTSEDDNGLYQWLNRARRKLAAGEIEEPFAGRIRAVLEFPDIRTYRYRAAHGLASPGEAPRRDLTGS